MSDVALRRKLDAAVEAHRAGRLDEAERRYGQILRAAPRFDDALHLFGLLRHQQGRHAEAEQLVADAIRLKPGAAVYYENLAAIQRSRGDLARVIDTCGRGLAETGSERLQASLLEALIGLGRFQQALEALDRLDTLIPPSADRLADRAFCLMHLGSIDGASAVAEQALAKEAGNGNVRAVLAEVASRKGDHAGAIAHWRAALRSQPDWAAARINLGLALLRTGDAVAAIEAFDQLPPVDDAGALATVLSGRAAAARLLGRKETAARQLRQAVAVAPAAESLSNLAEILRGTQPGPSLRLVERALALDPVHAAARNNLALAYAELDRLPEAVTAFRQAIALHPADKLSINNLADPLRLFEQHDQAEILHRRALWIDPGFAAARYGLGTLQLRGGDFARGWIGYDERFDADPNLTPRPFPQPRWRGETLKGKLLVWGEQGVGDEMVHGTMLPDLMRAGVQAIVECDRRLVPLFERSLPGLAFAGRADPPDPRLLGPDIAAQTPMASLGRVFRRSLDDFGKAGAYLVPRPDLLAHWRQRLADLGPGPKVGFAWRSRRNDSIARRFHPPILEWSPVLRQGPATFVSLQYGDFDSDIAAVESAIGVRIHRFPDLDLFNDFEGILALSAALDLAIATATTAFCLAAAAGAPVWLAPSSTDHFLYRMDGYPWFPTMRCYVHRHVEPWSETIGRIGADFARFLEGEERP